MRGRGQQCGVGIRVRSSGRDDKGRGMAKVGIVCGTEETADAIIALDKT
jgi:hypothetical protein